jgi:L-ascorbate metabolism protein UlaG (beta-lactamase superfamily)
MKTIHCFVAIMLVLSVVISGCNAKATQTATLLPTVTETVLVGTPTPLPTAETSFDGVRVTYVGNSGILITTGDKKILIDGMFDASGWGYSLPEYEQELLVNGRPPFDDIDLILCTHNHADHFDAVMISKYLLDHPNTVFVSTLQAASTVTGFGDRVIALDATTGDAKQTEVSGIQVEAIYLSHGTPPAGETEIVNNAYVITVNGITIFHTGDIDASLLSPTILKEYGLADKKIDIAFIPHFLLSNSMFHTLYKDVINSKYVVAIHYQLTDPLNVKAIETYYPDAVIFTEEMQNWEMPK